jgi:hypothetical protein
VGSLLERVLDRLFEYQEIRDGCEAGTRTDGPVYLKRYFLVKNTFDPDRSAGVHREPRLSLTWHRKSNGVQLYLHHILRSDADRELHDHPWNFLAIMLWRGYTEETQPECASCRAAGRPQGDCIAPSDHALSRKRPGMVLFRRAEHRHRVLLVNDRPAWSLVFTSAKRRSWGFWREGAFIPWRLFVARKCEEARR